jgi:hypothetical protein
MPLTLRDTWTEEERVPAYKDVPDYSVMSGKFTFGRIMQDRAAHLAKPGQEWSWAINGVHAGPSVMQTSGNSATLEEAKEAFRLNWKKWLAWAKLATVD